MGTIRGLSSGGRHDRVSVKSCRLPEVTVLMGESDHTTSVGPSGPPRAFLLLIVGLVLTGCSGDKPAAEPTAGLASPNSGGLSTRRSVPICEAVKAGDASRVQSLLTNKGSNPNSVCHGEGLAADMPVLSVAADAGEVEMVRALLKAGAEVDASNAGGFTALVGAAFRGHAEVAKVLLEAGGSVGARYGDGSTPLHAAAIGCRAEMVRLLLAAGASVNAQDRLKMTPLHDAASRDGCAQVVRALIEGGANVNAVEHLFGDTPLMSATKSCSSAGSQQIIAELLDAGANPLIANRRGENAVSRASNCGSPQVYRMITERARLFLANQGQGF